MEKLSEVSRASTKDDQTREIEHNENIELTPFKLPDPSKPIPIYNTEIIETYFFKPKNELYTTELKSVLRLCGLEDREKNQFMRDMIELSFSDPETVITSETLENVNRIKYNQEPIYEEERELNPLDSIINVCYSSYMKGGNPYWLDIPFILISRISDKLSTNDNQDNYSEDENFKQPNFTNRKRLRSEDEDFGKKIKVLEKVEKILNEK